MGHPQLLSEIRPPRGLSTRSSLGPAIVDAVNVVFKLQALGRDWPNDILISETTLQAVKSRLEDMQVEICGIGMTSGNLKIYRIRGGSGS